MVSKSDALILMWELRNDGLWSEMEGKDGRCEGGVEREEKW